MRVTRCSKYLFLWTNSIDRADNSRSLLYRYVPLHTVLVIYQCRQNDVSTYTHKCACAHIRVSIQAQRCPTCEKPKHTFLHWPFSDWLRLSICEFWHKMSEFTSSDSREYAFVSIREVSYHFTVGFRQCNAIEQYVTMLHNKNAVMQLCVYIHGVCKDMHI